MSLVVFFLYVVIFITACVAVYYLFKDLEMIYCSVRHNIPFVPSANVLRRAVADEICAHYSDAKTLCDIGSGYGGLMRYVARRCDVKCVGLENMPFCVLVSRVINLFTCTKCNTIWCNAFEYLEYGGAADIGVAYLGPGENDKLAAFTENFRVLITLDVPVAGLNPVRTIDVGGGATRYGRDKFRHKLFVYEF